MRAYYCLSLSRKLSSRQSLRATKMYIRRSSISQFVEKTNHPFCCCWIFMQDGERSNILDQRTTSCSRQSFLQSRMKYAPENLHNHQVFKFVWLKGPRPHFEKRSPHSRFCWVEHCMISQKLRQLRRRLAKLFRRWSLFPSKITLCSYSFSLFVPCLEHLPITFHHRQHHSKQIL